LHVLHSVGETTIFPKSYCGVLMSMWPWGYQLECLWGMQFFPADICCCKLWSGITAFSFYSILVNLSQSLFLSSPLYFIGIIIPFSISVTFPVDMQTSQVIHQRAKLLHTTHLLCWMTCYHTPCTMLKYQRILCSMAELQMWLDIQWSWVNCFDICAILFKCRKSLTVGVWIS
jgi:hypothetical protein